MSKLSKLKLNTKFILYIISAIIIIYAVIFSYIGIRMGPVLQSGIEQIADNYVARYANLFKSHLSEDKQISRTIADDLETFLPFSPEEKIIRTKKLLQRVYLKNPHYRAIYASWERKYVDSNWTKDYGRIRISLYAPPTSIADTNSYIIDSLNTFGDDINSSYYATKTNPFDELANPYEDVFFGKTETVTSVFNPMVYDGTFLGSTGLDIPLSRYTKIIENAEQFYHSSIFLVANDGVFVANQMQEMVGTSILNVIPNSEIDILKNIKDGESFSMYITNEGSEYYVTFYPLTITGTTTPWAVGVAVPKDEMKQVMKSNFIALLFVSIFGLLAMIIVVFYLTKQITGPITHITNMLKLMAEGKIGKVDELKITRKDEIGEIILSANKLVVNLRQTAEFAHEIGEGELETNFKVLNKDDILGNSLLNMRTSLVKADEEDKKRRLIEEKQNWATVGYAKFSDLLRNNTDNMEVFTYNVISNLVKYTDSNQGAFFTLNSDEELDKYLVMSSCYAYNRKKYVDKRIDLGSNLIGQCFLEGQTIHLTDIPEDYMSITSGLGDATPSSLIIIPLKFNDIVYGVMELASFEEYNKYQIEFIEKLGESIASTISTVKVNLQTKDLLEESKLKSEELAAQEEEMRQNMEELQTTQEESARREVEMNGILKALNSSYMVLELSLDADILSINENAKHIIDNNNDMEGNNLRTYFDADELDEFNELWDTVINGEPVSKQRTVNRSGKTITISESYTPIYDDMDEIYKVLNIAIEIEI